MPQKSFFFAEMGCIYIGPIYIKRQSDSDNFLTFWYTLVLSASFHPKKLELWSIQLPLLCLVPLLVNDPWHGGHVGLWHEDCFRLPVVQHVWHVPLHQCLGCLLEVLEGDDVAVPHVVGVGVALDHLLLQLLIREAKQLEQRGGWQG